MKDLLCGFYMEEMCIIIQGLIFFPYLFFSFAVKRKFIFVVNLRMHLGAEPYVKRTEGGLVLLHGGEVG